MQAKQEMQAIKALSNKNKIAVGQEYETGRVVNGKKEYAKMFQIEALSNAAGNTIIATELSNITPIKLEGIIKGATLVSNLPFMYTGQNSVYHYCSASGNSITIRVTGDMSMYSATEILYYTKN